MVACDNLHWAHRLDCIVNNRRDCKVQWVLLTWLVWWFDSTLSRQISRGVDMVPKVDQYYMHKHGGLYRVVTTGYSTVDTKEMVVYDHLYPFERKTWIRPMSEWTEDRFKLVTYEYVIHIMQSTERHQMQLDITMRKL